MRLTDLVERRQQQTQMMYHGTSSEFLHSILKQGLLANPPDRTYSGDADDPGPIGYETFGGVYITSHDFKALSAARDAQNKFGGTPIIIHIQHVIGSGTLDEDHVTASVGMAIRDEINNFYDNYDEPEIRELHELYGDFTSYETANRDAVVPGIVDYALHNLSKLGHPKPVARDIITAMVVYTLDHVDMDLIDAHSELSVLRHDGTYKDLLAKAMRAFNDDPTKFKNIQLDRNIGFRGKTKIVKITDGNGDNIYYQAPDYVEDKG